MRIVISCFAASKMMPALRPSPPTMSMRLNPSLRLNVMVGGAFFGPVIFMVTLPSKLAAKAGVTKAVARRSGRIFFMAGRLLQPTPFGVACNPVWRQRNPKDDARARSIPDDDLQRTAD